MRLIIATKGQAALCAVSFLYLEVFGAWAEHLPWSLFFPLGLGSRWLLVTFTLVRRARTKLPLSS